MEEFKEKNKKFGKSCTETCNFFVAGNIGRGGIWVATDKRREEIMERLRRLADRKTNDAVKLAFLSGEDADRVDELDLTGLVELKRNANGSFEAKFVDQVKVLEMMTELAQAGNTEAAEDFFAALGAAAGSEET